jgi:hypothetical protein
VCQLQHVDSLIGLISARVVQAALLRTSRIISESRARSKRRRAPSEPAELIQRDWGGARPPAFEFTLNPGALFSHVHACVLPFNFAFFDRLQIDFARAALPPPFSALTAARWTLDVIKINEPN